MQWLACILALGSARSPQDDAPRDHGGLVLSVYSGAALTVDGDLDLEQSGGTDLTFHGVSYEDRSLDFPIYYGLRLTYFLPEHAEWGVSLDFFHAKIFLEEEDTVRVTGARSGSPVDGREPIEGTIASFNLSHGLNFLTANLEHRRRLGGFEPYFGAGAGIVIPHVEARIAAESISEYQLKGPGFQGFAGVNFATAGRWSLFLEYKLSYAPLDLDVPGGSIRIEPLTHHAILGISFRLEGL